MRVAITGATGFVGRHLVLGLKDDHDILALARNQLHFSESNTPVTYTNYSAEELKELFCGCSAVIHLAAQRPYSAIGNSLLANILLDFRVFHAAEHCSVPHVIYASSRSVYGSQPTPWVEATPPAPTSLYGLAKQQSESTADFFARRGLRITTLRLAQIFGLGEYGNSAITTFIRNAYQGKSITLTATGIFREHLYIRDLVRAFGIVLRNPTSGTYNLGSGELVSLEDMVRTVFRAFGRQGGILKLDKPENIAEHSLMNSDLFRSSFSWHPLWSFSAAADEIANILKDKEAAIHYGFSLEQKDHLPNYS
jgi:UDP-glucose 4-epimerase